MQVAKQGRQPRQHRGFAHGGRVERSTFDESGDEQTALVMDDLRRQPADTRGLVTNDLVAAVDSQQRQLLADPDKIRLPAATNREVVIRKPARDSLDRDGTTAQAKLAQPLDDLSLGPTPPAAGTGVVAPKARFQSTFSFDPEPRGPGSGAINIDSCSFGSKEDSFQEARPPALTRDGVDEASDYTARANADAMVQWRFWACV